MYIPFASHSFVERRAHNFQVHVPLDIPFKAKAEKHITCLQSAVTNPNKYFCLLSEKFVRGSWLHGLLPLQYSSDL